jgi:acyl-CoA thioesterase
VYDRDRASQALGIVIRQDEPGAATATMTVTEQMLNGHDIAHGGYVFLLADTAFAYACNSYGPVTVAQSGQVTFLRPAVLGDELVARATERGRFGRSGIYDVTVSRTDSVVIAEFRGQSRQTAQR